MTCQTSIRLPVRIALWLHKFMESRCLETVRQLELSLPGNNQAVRGGWADPVVPVNVGVSDTQTAFQHKLTVKCGLGHLHRFTPCSKSSVRCTVEQDWAMMWRLCFVCRCGTLPCIKRDELVDCFNGSPQDHSKHATNCSCTEITNEQGPTQPLSPAAKQEQHLLVARRL